MTASLYLGRQEWFIPMPPDAQAQKNEVASRALVVHEDRILLVYHSNSDCWFTPGGRIAPGESLIMGLRREIEEETGLTVELGDLVGCFDVLIPKDLIHKFEFIFLSRPTKAPDFTIRPHTDSDPHGVVTKICWFTLEELRTLPRVFPDCIRNWPTWSRPRGKTYYGTKLEDGCTKIENIERFYLSSRVVATHDDRILMVYNGKGNFWFGPGGQIEFGEDITTCAVREVHEETGLQATAHDVIAVDEFYSPSYKIHQINLYTRCELASGDLPVNWKDTAATGHVAKSAFHTRQQLAALPRAYPEYMAELAWPNPVKEKVA